MENIRFVYSILIGICEDLKALEPPKCFIYKHLGVFRYLFQNQEFLQKLCKNISHICHESYNTPSEIEVLIKNLENSNWESENGGWNLDF